MRGQRTGGGAVRRERPADGVRKRCRLPAPLSQQRRGRLGV